MADRDYYNDTTPRLQWQRPSTPSVTQLKTALQTYQPATFTNAYMQNLTENDLLMAARQAGLTVAAAQTV